VLKLVCLAKKNYLDYSCSCELVSRILRRCVGNEMSIYQFAKERAGNEASVQPEKVISAS